MGRERWFRGDHEGRERPFDWYRLAKERDIPLEQARVLYEEALRRARELQGPHRNAEALYLELLEEARQEAWRPSPGKVSRTMLMAAERAGKRRKKGPIAPGKRTLTSYLEPPAPEVDNLASPDSTPRTTHPAGERLVPGTAAYRRFQANLLAAHGHFEELDALEAEEERLEADVATTMEASLPSSAEHAWWPAEGVPIQAAGLQGLPEEPVRLPESGGGAELPEDVRRKMEAAFDVDFSAVRIHEGSQARSMGALAFTQGTDIHFSPGQYQPGSHRGQELLGHELAHVVQQSQGRVAATGNAMGVPLNDDPALEKEADELGARAARGEKAAPGGAVASSGGDTAQRKANPVGEVANGVESSGEEMLSAIGDAATPTAQARMRGAPIQARVASGPIQRQTQKTYVPHTIHVDVPMTQEQFRVKAMIQVFGKVIDKVEWKNSKDSYVPENSPYTLGVDVDLLRQHRGQASKSKGIDVGEGGKVAGAEGRANKFHSALPSADKNALMAEIDRRYHAATGSSTKIEPGEKGKSELWFMIRDEVLFQHEYIANLPPQVKALIKSSTEDKELTPADYEKLFAIAKKIEQMPAGQVGDYASKVTGTTTDLDTFEASLDKYLAEMVEREKQGEEREKVHTKLIGLEEVYEKYKLYKTLLSSGSGMAIAGRHGGGGGGIVVSLKAGEMRKELETQLQAHGFTGVTEFEEYIKKLERAFEQEAANIAKDLLGKYAGKLHKESERYRNSAEVAALHQRLGGVRTRHAELEAQAAAQSQVQGMSPWRQAYSLMRDPQAATQGGTSSAGRVRYVGSCRSRPCSGAFGERMPGARVPRPRPDR